jgi:hypothetical protein
MESTPVFGATVEENVEIAAEIAKAAEGVSVRRSKIAV